MGDTDLQPSRGRPDFRIYTAALEVESAESTLVRMVGSSTEQDVQRNRMAATAINDMCDPALVGMTIFLNHKYDIPYDVYGSLVEAPKAQRKDGFVDVYLTADTDLRNPPASQVLQQIRDGRKHGCSIGCMVEKWSFAEESDEEAKDAIVIERVKPVEWSIVGIPANRRSWVENAIYGVFTRSLDIQDYDEAFKLAPTVKSLYSRNYERMTLGLTNTSERTRFERVASRPTPMQQLFWEPSRKTFILQGAGGLTTDVDRDTIITLLGSTPTPMNTDGAGEKETETTMLPELTEAAVAVQADGSHEPTTGHHNHPHADMHDGLHDHHHVHENDNNHSHSHDHHYPQENTAGGDPDGDADDQAMACATTPTDATPVTPVVMSEAPHATDADRETYLQSYNALGRILGFAAVDDTSRVPLATAGVATPTQFAQAIEVLERLSGETGEALENLYLSLALSPDYTPASTPLSASSEVHARRALATLTTMVSAIDAASATLATEQPTTAATLPTPVTLPTPQGTVPNTALSVAVDVQAVQGAVTQLQAQLAEQKAQHALLIQQYESLRGQGLGRPTSFTNRTVPATMLGSTVSIEAQTPEALRGGTTLVKRLDGVVCRMWPHGHGVHQRPELTTTQMSIMTNVDVSNYYDGLEVLVPHFSDQD